MAIDPETKVLLNALVDGQVKLTDGQVKLTDGQVKLTEGQDELRRAQQRTEAQLTRAVGLINTLAEGQA